MPILPADDARAIAVVTAIRQGDVEALQAHLRDHPELTTARIVDAGGVARTLLHVAADWPGHFPNAASTVAALAEAGADLDAPVIHQGANGSPETALHWAASNDDLDVLDALLDAGANVEAPGAVFTGGTPMSDAVVFAQWRAARRLLERGASTTIWQAAALGLLHRVQLVCSTAPQPTVADLTNAFWHACRGGQRDVAGYLLDRGADMHWIGHAGKTPLDVAYESGADDLIEWLRAHGACGRARPAR